MRRICFVIVAAFVSLPAFAQEEMQTLPLENLSAFRQQAGNWQIVGDVTMNPFVDIHAPATEPAPESKKRNKKKNQVVSEPPTPVTFEAGQGILLNMNDETRKDPLITNLEHGDIELEFEVMLPKGSNSGVYLQGRYEVQLLDSWGVMSPSFSDIGGIYRNWEKEEGKIYMGKAPLSNPCKAPGLWQKMKISFRAPKFDQSGKKNSNARFVFVELNGVRIHDNVEVPLPTGGPLENNETAKGPLMIQGDHGPVALRNIKYKLMKEADFSLSSIKYQTYYGNYKSIADFQNLKPASTGSLDELTCEVLEQENEYGVKYTAEIAIPEKDEYQFTVGYTGGIKLIINNQEVINNQRPDAWAYEKGKIALNAGKYPVEIWNFKDASWAPPRLALFVESANIYPQALHAFNSYPPDEDPAAPIFINVGNGVKMLRAFIDFRGDRKQRLTHTIGVADPVGVNYVYDLGSGNVVCVWRGNFVDATPMWHDRGDGSFRPRGGAQYLFTTPQLSVLNTPQEFFPAKRNENDFRSRGYRIDEKSGKPIFIYTYKGIEVEDKVYPENEGKQITKELSIKSVPENLHLKLAEGSTILPMPDGMYAIDDKQYYIKVNPNLNPVVRESNGIKELVVPVKTSSIKYSVIW